MARQITVPAWECEACGKVWQDERAANVCCKQYRCDVCGKETPRFWTRCRICIDNAAVEVAEKMTIAEYLEKYPGFPVVHDGDRFTFGDEFSVKDAMECNPGECFFGASARRIAIDAGSILDQLDEEAGCEESVFSDNACAELRRLTDDWNAMHAVTVYYEDRKTAILRPDGET